MTLTTTVIQRDSFKDIPFLTRLLELHTIPEEIYTQGTLPKITFDEYGRATPRILTVIGSRRHTAYGKQVLETLLASLQGYDVIILSGLAVGIDGLAHKNAIKNNLITISVPGSGLDTKVLYPHSHRQLKDDIIDHGGALLSELTDLTPAAPWTFPKRNRIMAALSDALLVIEAEEKSGTLITARLALELGRDIGAVPGQIFSPNASGTNMLIHEGAYPITSSSDLLSLLHLSEKETIKHIHKEFEGNEKILMELLREPLNKDKLFEQSQLSFHDFLITFSSLEIDGHLEESLGEVHRLV